MDLLAAVGMDPMVAVGAAVAAAATDPIGTLAHIYSAVQSLSAAAGRLKANNKQAARLAERAVALLPQLRALEQRQRAGGAGAVQAALGAQLAVLLQCVQDAQALAAKFGDAGWAGWAKRLIKKDDYGAEFKKLNERLAEARAQLGFDLQVSAVIAAEQDAEDAKADLEAIRVMLPELMAAVQEADAAAERRYLSAADRQQQQMQLQQQQAQMLAQIDARLARAELRSQKAQAAVQAAAAAAAVSLSPAPIPASASSPSSPTAALLQIPLEELRLDPRPVGSGGFGEVFKAQWTTRHMTVAVKKLCEVAMSPAHVAEFNREVAFLHALPYHEHVLQLHGVAVDQDSDTYLMVMSWMEQGSLHKLLKASRSDPTSLPLARRLQLCIECAMGINHLHQLRPPVIHRDIKSLNFLIDKHGQVKVCDFGLARMRSATATHSTAAQAAGTLCWMPPEFLQSDEDSVRATTASDVYSLAVVCWEVLAGEEPYAGLKYHQIRRAIENGKLLTIPPHLPAGVAQLLRACWAMDPSKRPSCSDVIDALQRLQNEVAVATEAPIAAVPIAVAPIASLLVSPAPIGPNATSSAHDAVSPLPSIAAPHPHPSLVCADSLDAQSESEDWYKRLPRCTTTTNRGVQCRKVSREGSTKCSHHY